MPPRINFAEAEEEKINLNDWQNLDRPFNQLNDLNEGSRTNNIIMA